MENAKSNAKLLLDAELVEQTIFTPVKTQLRLKKHGRGGRPTPFAARKVDSYNARRTNYLMAIGMAGIRPGDIKRELGDDITEKLNKWFDLGKGLSDDDKKAIARLVGLDASEIFCPDGAKYKG